MRDRKTKERDMMLAMLFMFSHDVSSIWHGVLFHRDTLQRVVGVVGRLYCDYTQLSLVTFHGIEITF